MLYLANIEARLTDGIYKKIIAQTKAWSKVLGTATLICKDHSGILIVN